PVKVGLAHAQILSELPDVDALFFPTVISEKTQKNGMPRVFCPYVITYPSVIAGALSAPKPVIAPSIDFRFTRRRMVKELTRAFEPYGISSKEIARAYEKAEAAQKKFLHARHEEGEKILERVRNEKKIAITLIGRPYNLYDREINLGLTEYFKSIPGVEVFPFEMLIDPDRDNSDLSHVYWNYGERILYAAEKIKSLEHVYPVYFTNFGCGPDSFILTRFEKIMKGKPYLIIELDEHGSDTGYQTRIEAFVDVLRAEGGGDVSHNVSKEKFYSFWDKKDRKLWIPPLHETSTGIFAAGFRAWGYDAEALPAETRESFEIGKQTVRGSECLPASTTIGAFIGKMREINADPAKHAFLMATAEGPCRFGQYMVLHRNILDANGMKDVEIFAPTSINSYMGMPSGLRAYLWEIVVGGDFIYKMICHTRPYEIEKGSVDAAVKRILASMEEEIGRKKPILPLMRGALAELAAIPVKREKRPLVGIVGEIYVRSNPFCNDSLVRFIEESGGEAWLSPLSEWFIYTAYMERYFASLYDKGAISRALVNFKTRYLFTRMHDFEKAAAEFIPERIEPEMEKVLEVGVEYIPIIFEGETILTIARGKMFLEQGASLVVNCAPFGCMPGNITQSIFHKIRGEDGKPVISLFYDGESDMNRIVKVYLNNLSQ
ncbi:MAG TPA: acyl-CoA dehydratase activase-related protein, partial [Spirochaetota bacterium]|nr:acyl-CoA dehydratase activase-related protein [Spirochaetota bacterium]